MALLKGVLVLLLYVLGVRAAFTEISYYTLQSGDVVYQRFGAFDKNDSPFGGSSYAFINYNLNFLLSKNNFDYGNASFTLGEVLVFHYLRRPYIGYGGLSVLEKRHYCCTKKLYDEGHCLHQNSLIIDSSLDRNDIYYDKLNYSQYHISKNAILQRYTELQHTGIWYIFIANCQDDTGIELSLSGTIEWKNPYGYLPGQILGFLPLCWIMAFVYLALIVTWITLAIKNHKDMMDLQHGIGVVLFIAFIENLLWAINYTAYNINGQASDVLIVFGTLFSSSMLTVVRTLMLVVAVGYTITRPILTRGYKIGISILTIIYFVTVATNKYIDLISETGIPVPSFFEYFAFTLLLLTNSAFFGWTGWEMFMTMRKLKSNEGEKYVMYKRLGILLILSIVISLVIVVTHMVIQVTDTSDEHFRAYWLWEGYWEFIYASCIAYVAWVWRPTDHNTRYAYVEVAHQDEEPVDRAIELENHAQDDEKLDESSHSVSSDSEGKKKKKKAEE